MIHDFLLYSTAILYGIIHIAYSNYDHDEFSPPKEKRLNQIK